MDWHWWGTWWPWAEANQGFLSFAALVAALILALAENRRANLAGVKQFNDFIDMSIALTDDLLNLSEAGLAKARAGANFTAEAHDLHSAVTNFQWALEVVRPSAPPDGPLALILRDMYGAQYAVLNGLEPGRGVAALEARIEQVKGWRERLRARRR